MEIEKYILNSYPTVNPFTATILLEEKLLEKGYVVVIDEENKFHGILTTCDLIKRPHKLIIDCLTEKEHLSADESIISGLDKFKSNQCSAMPVFKKNKFIGVVERQKVVDELKIEINKLYKKSIISQEVKQSFLNNLSHEVRTPLNGLLGFLEIVSALNIDDKKSKNNAHYNIIRKSADRFLFVLNDLIDLALLNSGDNLAVEIHKINIENIFSDLKEYFEMTMLTSNRNVSINYINPDSSLVIMTDEKKIKHILYHLIDNAIKFSSNNEKITYGYKTENNNITFFVKNSSSLIPKEKKEKIFEIFEKQDHHNKELVEGLGIGLPLVKKLSELLNGKIEFVSKEIQTTFLCTIPLI